MLTLDFGTEVGGFAYIDVEHADGPSQVEFKFAETFHGLTSPTGDGEWLYVNTLSNTFSTETIAITEACKTQTYFLQGGYRWQSITLLPGSHALRLSASGVGVDLVRERSNPKRFPGQFSTSDRLYGNVFDLGTRTLENACYEAHSQPSTWKITPSGAYLRGQTPALSSKSTNSDFNDLYTLEFDTKIERGGTGWVAGTFQPSYLVEQAYFVITSNYPKDTTFTNTNRSIVPPNTLAFVLGYNLLNSTVDSGPVVHHALPIDVQEGRWYHVATKLNNDSWTVSIDGKLAATISLADYQQLYPASPEEIPTGAFGFGPFRDQAAYIKDVTVVSSNGTTIYSNTMTAKDQSLSSLLYEYNVHENADAVCLDGAKRDRLVWTGDFAHTSRTLGT